MKKMQKLFLHISWRKIINNTQTPQKNTQIKVKMLLRVCGEGGRAQNKSLKA